MTDDDEYRRHAAECNRMAASTRNDNDKSRWLKMAESWMRMVRSDSNDQSSNNFDAAQAEKGTGQKNSDYSH